MCKIVAAINPSGGSYSVNSFEVDDAIRRRLLFVMVEHNAKEWLKFAQDRFDDDVIDFVAAHNNLLLDNDLKLNGKAYPNPAAWEKVSRLMKKAKEMGPNVADNVSLNLSVSGLISQAVCDQFFNFVRDNDIAVKPEDILYKYASTQRKIRKMKKRNRIDALREIASSLSSYMYANSEKLENEFDKIRNGFVDFLDDLPEDLAMAMLKDDFAEENDFALALVLDLVRKSEKFINEVSPKLKLSFSNVEEELE